MACIHYTGYSAVCTKTLTALRELNKSKKLKYFWFSQVLWVYLTRKTCGQHQFTSLNILGHPSIHHKVQYPSLMWLHTFFISYVFVIESPYRNLVLPKCDFWVLLSPGRQEYYAVGVKFWEKVFQSDRDLTDLWKWVQFWMFGRHSFLCVFSALLGSLPSKVKQIVEQN